MWRTIGTEFEEQSSYQPYALPLKSQVTNDRDLYALCQQLTRQNRELRKEINEMRKEQESNQGAFLTRQDQEEFRKHCYDGYKKKSMEVLASLKLLYSYWNEKKSLRKKEGILDMIMQGLKKGRNPLNQMLRLYQQFAKETEQGEWNMGEFEQEASDKQNEALRKYNEKLEKVFRQQVENMRRGMEQIRCDLLEQRASLGEDMKSIRKELAQRDKQEEQEKIAKHERDKKNSQISTKKAKKKAYSYKKSYINENDAESKVQKRRGLSPNKHQSIDESLQFMSSLQTDLPLSLKNTYSIPPRPNLYHKAVTPTNSKGKQSTIVDQLRTSLKGKYSNSGVSDKDSRKSRSRQKQRNSDVTLNAPGHRNSVKAYTNLPGGRGVKLNYNYR